MNTLLKYICALIMFVAISTETLSAQSCAVMEHNTDYSVEGGESDTVALGASVKAIGDLVVFTGWCYQGCTPVGVTLGSQRAIKTSVSGNSDSQTGQGFIYYILSAAGAGLQTITWKVSGVHAGIQVSYIDFNPSAGCSFVHHIDSLLGSGTGGTANTPSITPALGDLLFNFTWVSEHAESVNSPWSCSPYEGPGKTGNCQMETTRNTVGYILGASMGSIANNVNLTHPTDTWQALITSFSMVSNNTRPEPPTNLTGVVN